MAEDINYWQEKFVPCQYSDRLLNKLNLLNTKVCYPVDINEITKAIYYARKYHGSQMRQSGEPYYSHPVEVAYMTAKHTAVKIPQYFRTDLIVTGLLHDTIEDTELTKDMISEIFDQQIANQVDDLTRIKIDKNISAAETLNLLFSQHKKDVLYLKLFDRLHNISTLNSMPYEKVNKILKETLGYFIPLAVFLNCNEVEKELHQLCFKFSTNHNKIDHINKKIIPIQLPGDKILLSSLGFHTL